MDNLSFHITDITANSIRAKASDIEIDMCLYSKQLQALLECTNLSLSCY